MMKIEPLSMITEEVIAVLESRGLTVYPDRYGVRPILYEGTERVGTLYVDSDVYLAEYIPSLVGMRYPDVKKSSRYLSDKGLKKWLDQAIDDLFDTLSRIDREMRDSRIENVKRYFKNKRISAEYSQREMSV